MSNNLFNRLFGGGKQPRQQQNSGENGSLLSGHTITSIVGNTNNMDEETKLARQQQLEERNNRTTDAQTMMHILKANIGTGVLAMPNAFKNVGLWMGFLLVPIIGAICIHCMNILIQSHNHLCDRFNYESLDYDHVAALSLACGPKTARRMAKKASFIVTVFLMFTQFGFCCVYIMFVVENLQLAALNLFNIQYSTTTYLLLVFPIIWLTSCTSNLKHLARISTLANVLQLTGLALIFFDLLQFHTYSQSRLDSALNVTTYSPVEEALPPRPQVEVQVEQVVGKDLINGMPLFFATAVYAFEGIGVVLPLIKEMQEPARISGPAGVLNTSMTLVAILYMGMGYFGYSKYGQLVQGSITLNLPETPLNEAVRFIFALAIGLSYSLQFYVPWTIMWPYIDESLFYSYRQRESRDKLGILNTLSAENQWAIDESQVSQFQQSQSKPASTLRQDLDLDENNSVASTFATSYSMSTQQPRSRALSQSLAAYGSTNQTRALLQVPSSKKDQRRRNRLEDVREQSQNSQTSDALPEVHWRPPPRSMRGKRKLVRYTLIFVFVSFTFVAAALIPRLDLFIALIGALASSCLAIIFPAIIQLCTFWDEHDEETGAAREEKAESSPTPKRSLKWRLFVLKNSLLVLFGILGLVTGSWISLAKLAAAYK